MLSILKYIVLPYPKPGAAIDWIFEARANPKKREKKV